MSTAGDEGGSAVEPPPFTADTAIDSSSSVNSNSNSKPPPARIGHSQTGIRNYFGGKGKGKVNGDAGTNSDVNAGTETLASSSVSSNPSSTSVGASAGGAATAPARKRRKKQVGNGGGNGNGQATLMRSEGGGWALGRAAIVKADTSEVSAGMVVESGEGGAGAGAGAGAGQGDMGSSGEAESSTAGAARAGKRLTARRDAGQDGEAGNDGIEARIRTRTRTGRRSREKEDGSDASFDGQNGGLSGNEGGSTVSSPPISRRRGTRRAAAAIQAQMSSQSTTRSRTRTRTLSPVKRDSARSTSSPPIINLISSDPVDVEVSREPIPTRRRRDRNSNGNVSGNGNGNPPRTRNPNRRDSDVTITAVKLDRPWLMSRTNSTSSKGASHLDAIDVDVDVDADMNDTTLQQLPAASGQAKQPRKLVFAADQKVAHSFFGRSRDKSRPRDGAQDSGAMDETLSTSPVTPLAGAVPPVTKPAKALAFAHPFFQAKTQGEPGKLRKGWGRGIKEGEEWHAPYPGRLWSGHLGYVGSVENVSIEDNTRPLKRRKVVVPLAEETDFWKVWREQRYSDLEQERHWMGSIPEIDVHVTNHPAVSSVSRRHREANRETWCHRYRPLAANQVLGNETESIYLRDWLKALSVGNSTDSTKPKVHVTRRVPRRKAELLDGWIVDDINDFSDEDDSDEEEFEQIEEPSLSFDARPTGYPPFEARLANTMLLVGPHGSGKSAAVYAAAEELGWEVFEVYPGIGRRTGPALMNLVGDVGRNHIVGQTKSPKKSAPKVVASFFGTSGGVKKERAANGPAKRGREDDVPMMLGSQGSEKDPIDCVSQSVSDSGDEGGVEGTVGDGEGDKVHAFKQSLILLDEADLLYDEEGTFWPAVVSLIAESRRPVIITCNDIERIPIPSLPLQAILQYRPAPAESAIPYLAAIASREGLDCSTADIRGLFAASHSIPPDLLEQPLAPNGHEAALTFDLRRAITQLQLDRSDRVRSGSVMLEMNSEKGRKEERLEGVGRALEARSFADAWVAPRASSRIEVSGVQEVEDWKRAAIADGQVTEVDRYQPTSDDLLGYNLLRKPSPSDDQVVLSDSEYSSEMSAAIRYLGSRDVYDASRVLHFKGNLQQDMTTYVRSLLPALDPLIPLTAPLLPHSSLFTDYLPVIRDIVRTDDILEAADEYAIAHGQDRIDRRTGRPKRATTLLQIWGVGGGVKKEEYRRYFDGVLKKEEEGVMRVGGLECGVE